MGYQAKKHNVIESSPHYPSDQTLFFICEKFLRRATSGRYWSLEKMSATAETGY
jgi:hypothetical protein